MTDSQNQPQHAPHPPTSFLPRSTHSPEAQHLLNIYGFTAWNTLERDLNRHPYLRHRTTFPLAYTHALWHRILTAARNDGHLTDTTYKSLETITGIPAGRLRDWRLGEKEPHLERTLQIHETARQYWEHTLPQEAKQHLIDPSLVYTTFHPLLDHTETHTLEAPTTGIKTLYHHNKNQRLIIAELKPYHKTGPQQLRTIAHAIIENRSELEHKLTKRLNLPNTHEELRIAVDHGTLYLWRKTTHPDHWLNTYRNELLYLTPKIKEDLINKARRHLNVNTQQLGQLLAQLTDHKGERSHTPRAAPYELTHFSPSLHGNTLHLLLDAADQTVDAIKPYITQIGRIANHEKGGGIQNPRFPQGRELDILRARLLAIGLSDCHIHKDTRVMSYHENDLNRIRYVTSLFRRLGDCTYKLEFLRGNRTRLTITAPVGRLLEYWGVPRGDKHLYPNARLPEVVRLGKPKVKQAYLAEVIPEDGFFVNRAGAYKFGIKRAQILDAGLKSKIYGYPTKITPKHTGLIKKYGVKRKQAIRDNRPRNEITLTKGRLKELIRKGETQKDQHIAQQLEVIIKTNPSQLLKDEKELAESLGIKMQMIFKELKLQESGRVSTLWEIYTKSSTDTLQWATLAEPSSGEKQSAVRDWIIKYQGKNSIDSTKAEL